MGGESKFEFLGVVETRFSVGFWVREKVHGGEPPVHAVLAVGLLQSGSWLENSSLIVHAWTVSKAGEKRG